jgi:acetolactate synthase I/II/III large subunit
MGRKPAIVHERSVAATLVGELRRRGVRHMVGVPGGGSSLDLIQSGADQGVEFVLARTETAAALMAAVTAELTGVPGVVLTGLGPGAAAVTNGVAHARLDRAPLVVITDAYPPALATFVTHQRIDHAALFAPLVKGSLGVTSATSLGGVRELLDAALRPPRGPVHVDLSAAPAGEPMAEGLPPHQETPAAATGPWQVERARALLADAERPVLLVGLEARDAPDATRRLAAELAGPVLSTWKARGVVADDDPLFVGLVTGGAAEAACLGEADLIVRFGFDPVELIPQPWRYAAPVLELAEAVRDGYYARPAASLIGPLAQGAAALSGAAPGGSWRASAIRAQREAIGAAYSMAPSSSIGPLDVVEAAIEAAPARCRAAIDAGAHMFPVIARWPAREPNAVLISNGLATMGFALPAAIGSALAEPDRPVTAFIGDGGLAMCLGELATAAEQRCPIVIVVFNDAALSLIDVKQEARGLPSRGCRTMPIDVAAAARGFGLQAERIRSRAALRPAFARAFASKEAYLLDIQVDPSGYGALLKALRG